MTSVATRTISDYAEVNGIRLYYEVHGDGPPLILLHGGLGAIEIFGWNIPALAAKRHGPTASITTASLGSTRFR